MIELENKEELESLEKPKVDEKAMVRKMTLHIVTYLFFLYILAFLDRANLGNAHATLIHDINVSDEQYSIAVSIFFIGYILFELPSNVVLKSTTAPRWFACIMMCWGTISCCNMFMNNFASLVVLRILLGIAEAGFLPGVIYYLSFWFTPNERAFRLSFFLSSVAVAGAVSGLAAYGLLQLEGVSSLKGWQWLFLIEGIPSIIFGLLTIFILPTSPNDVDWLTPEEKEFAATRNPPSEQTKITCDQVKIVFSDIRIWLAAFLACSQGIVLYSISFFLPAIIRQFGFSDIVSNLLSVPPYTLAAIAIILNGFHSDRTSERFYHILFPAILSLAFWIALCYALTTQSVGLQYSMILFGTCSSMMAAPITLVWPMDYIPAGSATSVIAPAITVGTANLGGIIGPQLFGISYTYTKSYSWAAFAMALCALFSIIFCTILHCVLRKWGKVEDDNCKGPEIY